MMTSYESTAGGVPRNCRFRILFDDGHGARQCCENPLLDRYQAAYIFGLVARSEAPVAADLDVQFRVDHKNRCAAINHPVINGVKLDVTFLSFDQLAARREREIAQ